RANGIGGSAAGTVSPAAAATLVLNGLPASLTAGTPATVMVTLRDSFGNIATRYPGTVAFASSDPRAPSPPNYTFSSTDNGVPAALSVSSDGARRPRTAPGAALPHAGPGAPSAPGSRHPRPRRLGEHGGHPRAAAPVSLDRGKRGPAGLDLPSPGRCRGCGRE